MANQPVPAAFNIPQSLISGFLYGLNYSDRVELGLPQVLNVDTGELEPNVAGFGNGLPVHKAVITIGAREFLLYSWNVREWQGIERNQSLAKIRPSTHYHGEVLIFIKGMTLQVPFLKNVHSILKEVVEQAVGGYITTLLNAQDGRRAPPNQLVLSI